MSAQYYLMKEEQQENLREGDRIRIVHEDLCMFSDGFQSTEVTLVDEEESLSSIFIIELAHHPLKTVNKTLNYNQSMALRHSLSSKYLTFSQNFTTRGEIFLTANPKQNHHFLLLPLFKCQALRNTKLRSRQQYKIVPVSSEYDRDTVGLVVGKHQKGMNERVPIYLRKNQFSHFSFMKNSGSNGQKVLRTLQLYQLRHHQLERVVSVKELEEMSQDYSSQAENPYHSLVVLQKQEKEVQQNINARFVIRFYANKHFLGFNKAKDKFLADSRTKSCLFKLQPYFTEDLLQVETVLKIQHIQSGEYLSLDKNVLKLKKPTSSNVWQFRQIPNEELTRVLLVNSIYQSLAEGLELIEGGISGSKVRLLSTLDAGIQHCFRDNKVQQLFMNCESISTTLKAEEQQMFAKVDYINLLHTICSTMVKNMGERLPQADIEDPIPVINQNRQIINKTMLLLCAICRNNKNNLQIFSQHLASYFEYLSKIEGTVQLFYNIFGNCSVGLGVLANLQYTFQGKSFRTIQVILQHFYGKVFTLGERINIVKMLRSLVEIQNHNLKVKSHSQVVLQFWQQQRINNILFRISAEGTDRLIIHLNSKESVELKQLLGVDSYLGQKQLVIEQLKLLVSVCRQGGKEQLNFFHSLVNQKIIQNYLKLQKSGDVKAIFLHILSQIYLNKHEQRKGHLLIVHTHGKVSSSKNITIPKQTSLSTKLLRNQVQMQMADLSEVKGGLLMSSGVIRDIKRLVMNQLRDDVDRSVFGNGLIRGLKVLKTFLELQICSLWQFQEVLNSLTSQIGRALPDSLNISQDFMLCWCSLQIFWIKKIVDTQIVILIDSLKTRLQTVQNVKSVKQDINLMVESVIADKIPKSSESKVKQVVEQILLKSLANQRSALLIKGLDLKSQIGNLGKLFLDRLQSCIVIDSNHSQTVFCKIAKISSELAVSIRDICSSKRQLDNNTTSKLNNILQQLCEMIDSTSNQPRTDLLAQRLMSEMCILDSIVQFIVDKRQQLKRVQTSALFDQIFRFMRLFFRNCPQNCIQNQTAILKLKYIFTYNDRGQVKLLYELTKAKLVVNRQYDFLLSCWLSVTRHCFPIRLEVPLGLLILLKNWGQKDREIQVLKMIDKVGDDQVLCGLLKVSRIGQSFSLQSSKMSKSKQQWTMYIVLVLKLFNQLVPARVPQINCKFLVKMRQTLPLRLLLGLLQQSFHLQATQDIAPLNVFMLKQVRNQIMSLILSLYSEGGEDGQLMIQVLKRIGVLFTSKYLTDSHNQSISSYLLNSNRGNNFELKLYLVDYVSLHLKKGQQLSPQSIHTLNFNLYLFVNIYYPFCFQLLQIGRNILVAVEQENSQFSSNSRRKASNTDVNSKGLKEQSEKLEEYLFNNFKNIVQEYLTFDEFANYSQAYSVSVQKVQQICHKKAGLRHDYQESDQTLVLEGHQVFQPNQLSFALSNALNNQDIAQKKIYSALFSIHLNIPNKRQSRNSKQQYKMGFMDRKKMIELMLKQFKQQKIEVDTFSSYCVWLQELSRGWEGKEQKVYQNNLQYFQVMAKMSQTRDDIGTAKLASWIRAQTVMMSSEERPSVTQRYRQQTRVIQDQPFKRCFSSVMERLIGQLNTQANLYTEKQLLLQSQTYFMPGSQILSPEQILNWLILKLRQSASNPTRYRPLLVSIICLLKSYLSFTAQFNYKYISKELHNKLSLCLHCIYEALNCKDQTIFSMVVDQGVADCVNTVLGFDDSLERTLEELEMSELDVLRGLARGRIGEGATRYLQAILQLYNNSLPIYHQSGLLDSSSFPLLPSKFLFKQLKNHCINIMRQFQSSPIAPTFFSQISTHCLDTNILNTHQTYTHLFQTYSIATVYPHLHYANTPEQQLANNLSIQNAVKLVALKMCIQLLNGQLTLSNRYSHMRDNMTTTSMRSYLIKIKSFFYDLGMLIISPCLRCCRKRRNQSMEEIFDFFLQKVGKVEIAWGQQLFQYDFMLYPQCLTRQSLRKRCLEGLNLGSSQLKKQSVSRQMNRFTLYFQNQFQFFCTFHRFPILPFLAHYPQIIKLVCYVIVIIQNVLLVTDQIGNLFFDGISTDTAFGMLAIINLLFGFMVVIVFLLKDMPLVVKVERYNLQEGVGMFSQGFTQLTQGSQTWVVALKTIFTFDLFYHLIYLIVTALTLYNKLFAALLLLDVLVHIPSLSSLLKSIWVPKYQILLTIIAFVIIQYFFSILLYFFFQSHVNNHCPTLGQCFSFIFSSTFRAVNGFVGYNFQQNQINNNTNHLQISLFSVFQNIYVIVIHLIMFAVMLAVVINSFIMAKAESTRQAEGLRASCLVCNVDRDRLNLGRKGGFHSHIRNRHHLFTYFNCKYKLNHQNRQLMSDVELWVLQSEGNDWLPQNRAIQLVKN